MFANIYFLFAFYDFYFAVKNAFPFGEADTEGDISGVILKKHLIRRGHTAMRHLPLKGKAKKLC